MNGPLSLELTTPGQPVHPADLVILTCAIQNNSEQELYVNARFVAAPALGDLQLSVQQEGRELPALLRIRMPPLRASDFVQLDPGQRVVAGVNLSKLFPIHKPGTYTIRCLYVSEVVPPELKDLAVFKGRVAAVPVQLRVAP